MKRYSIKVSDRVYRVLDYAGRVYNKSASKIIEKLLDAPLSISGVKQNGMSDLPRKKENRISNWDIIERGLKLLADIDPKKSELCKEEIKRVRKEG